MKPIPDDVRDLINQWAEANAGRVYAPVLHPEFKDLPFHHGPERFDMILPHLGHSGGTVLDIGSHWGYMAHRLEALGYHVTAVEHADQLFRVLDGLRGACECKFAAVHASIFDLQGLRFDIVLALNIFHHFLKKKPRYDRFVPFLERLDCKVMIFQAHRQEEPQMRGSYRNFGPDEFASFVAGTTGLTQVEHIGTYNQRKIFRLAKPGA